MMNAGHVIYQMKALNELSLKMILENIYDTLEQSYDRLNASY